MLLGPTHRRPHRDTLVALGRVPQLPSVWSNCLAGYLLGGGGGIGSGAALCLGATCLYLGGTFLNDAFDVEFDRLHHRDRPIPSGKIGLDAVWRWGFAWLGLGTVILVLLGNATGAFAALLLFCIILYNAIHKLVGFSPALMAACRFFLILTAASVGETGATGLAIWHGLALATYVTGVATLAGHENSRTGLPRWPALLLTAPLLLSLFVNTGEHRFLMLLQIALVGLWLFACLQPAMMSHDINVRRSVDGLMAGIVLVDWLALGTDSKVGTTLGLLVLFLLTLALQRWVARA